MKEKNLPGENYPKKLPLNIAIIGGGKTCKFFLEFLLNESFPFVYINLVGVCDINPNAEGLLLAKKAGIYTTDDFKEFFRIKDLDGIIELTNSKKVLLDILHLKPKGVGVLDHNICRLLKTFFSNIDQKLKSAEQQVVLEKMISEFLIQQTNEQIVVLNTDFTIAEANEAYLNVLGKSKQEVVGAHCYKIIHGFDMPCSSSQPGFDCPMLETLRTGESAHVINEHNGPEGPTAYYNMVTYPVKNPKGEVVQVIEIWRDITEVISSRWEKRVKELKADLNRLIQEDRMISLGKLAASCVHEINNPIQGLLTFSDLMLKIVAEGEPSEKDLQQLKEFLSLMTNELERCGNIVSGLLSFSRQSSMAYENIDLSQILDSVLTLTRHRMELQKIQLVTELSDSPLVIKGDATHLQQCFLNLVFNAIEAMPEGGRLDVISRHDISENQVVIEIRDTGCGISEEDMGHIFDPFFTTKPVGQGTGLGLSIVYGIVKNHNGNIRIDSKVGQGSSFVLEFSADSSSLNKREKNHGQKNANHDR